MIGSIIGWIVFGLVAGFIARAIKPGNDSMGLVPTIVLGVVGSLVGGGVAYLLKLGTSPYEPAGWLFSIGGAILLLAGGFFGTRGRTAIR